MSNMITQEKKWQRESDARTLAEAESIKSSPSRLKGARTEAKSMVKRVEREAKSLNKIAKPTPGKSRKTKKTTTPRSKGGMTVRSNTNIPGVKKRR